MAADNYETARKKKQKMLGQMQFPAICKHLLRFSFSGHFRDLVVIFTDFQTKGFGPPCHILPRACFRLNFSEAGLCVCACAMDGVHPAVSDWRSVKPGPKSRVHWGQSDVTKWADKLLEAFPQSALQMVYEGQVKGLTVVRLKGPTLERQDVLNNQLWLKTLVPMSPIAIPSSFFLADVFMEIDKRLGGRLLVSREGEAGRRAKVAKALDEGNALRDIWSKVRRNFRDSPHSRDEDIECIKQLFQRSDSPSAASSSSPAAATQNSIAFQLHAARVRESLYKMHTHARVSLSCARGPAGSRLAGCRGAGPAGGGGGRAGRCTDCA